MIEADVVRDGVPWVIYCGRCGAPLGTTGPVAVATTHAPKDPVHGWMTRLPGMVRLDDNEDVQRWGLRRGAFRNGRSPLRREPYTVDQEHGLIAFEIDSRVEMCMQPVFDAYCHECGQRNRIDVRVATSDNP